MDKFTKLTGVAAPFRSRFVLLLNVLTASPGFHGEAAQNVIQLPIHGVGKKCRVVYSRIPVESFIQMRQCVKQVRRRSAPLGIHWPARRIDGRG